MSGQHFFLSRKSDFRTARIFQSISGDNRSGLGIITPAYSNKSVPESNKFSRAVPRIFRQKQGSAGHGLKHTKIAFSGSALVQDQTASVEYGDIISR